MVLGFVESLIPIPFPVPGIRLGLANLVTVAGLYLVGIRGTAAVTVLRIVLTGLSFGNPYSMAYGLSGSLLSLLVMAAAKKRQWFSPVGISILGGIAHNVGQVSFAAFIVRTAGVFLLSAGAPGRRLRGRSRHRHSGRDPGRTDLTIFEKPELTIVLSAGNSYN